MNERLACRRREQASVGGYPDRASCLGDKRWSAPGSWSCYLRQDISRNRGRDLNPDSSRRLEQSKNNEGSGEALMELADEAVAARGRAAGRCPGVLGLL